MPCRAYWRIQGDAASSQPTVYTRANPGKWAGKEDAHEPQAAFTRLDDEGNYTVDVVVNHDMSPVHWISHISLRDQDGRLLGEKSLLGTDAKADASFRINTAGLTKLKAYGLCNLHGLWLHEYPLPA